MSIIKKVKLWWKSTTTTEKVLFIFSGISTTAAVAGMAANIKTRHSMEDVKIDVKLYPGGKDDPNPVELKPNVEPDIPVSKIQADMSSEKWEVWNPEWITKNESKDGYESTRLADALDALLRQDGPEDIDEAAERVEDLARQFAYLEGNENAFRERFPYLKDHAKDVYTNVEETKGE